MNFIKEIKQAQEFQKKGNFDKAISIYKNILFQDKENFEANNGLAITFILNNNINQSVNILNKMIELYPKRYEPLVNLSNIYLSKNKFHEAIKLLTKANKIKTCDIKILESLSYSYFKINDFVNSKKNIKNLLHFNKNNFFVLNILGQIYFKEEKIDESISYFNSAIKSNNKFWPPYDNLMTLYEKTNKLEEFEFILSKALKFIDVSKNYKLKYFQSLLYFRQSKYQNAIDLLKKIKKEVETKKFISPQSYYDLLGKNYDKIKKFDLAYVNFTKRNQIIENLEENKKFDKKILLELIKNYKNYFVKKNIKNFKIYNKIDNFNDPVFLIGFPRSGTTLLDSILRSHSKTLVLEEKPYISAIRDKFFKNNFNLISALKDIKKSDIIKLREEYFRKTKSNFKTKQSKIIIDKLPLNIIEIGFIKRIFPKSKFILMVRKPHDAILSCFLTDFQVNEAMTHFLKIEDSINLYLEVFELWDQYRINLNLKFQTIKYEDIILNFDETIKKLIKFLNINWEENLKNFQLTAIQRSKINTPSYNQVIKPLNSESIDRWKKYDEIKFSQKLNNWVKYFNY